MFLPFLLVTAPTTVAATPNAPQTADGDRLVRMVKIYDAICLRAFPDDHATDAAAVAMGGTPLPADKIAIYLHDDPGRGWTIADGDGVFVVTVEAPPYHACAVRRETANGFADLSAYERVADAYIAAHGPFSPPSELDIPRPADQPQSHLSARSHETASGVDTLIKVTDTGPAGTPMRVEVRFVHQIIGQP